MRSHSRHTVRFPSQLCTTCVGMRSLLLRESDPVPTECSFDTVTHVFGAQRRRRGLQRDSMLEPV